MEPFEQIQPLFQSAIDCHLQAMAALPSAIGMAGMTIFNQLLQGNKILICGSGNASCQARYFATLLVNRFERQRPGLPAIALGGDSLSQAITDGLGQEACYARQMETLGQPGDVLILLSLDNNQPALLRAVLTAREREMPLILLSGGHPGKLHELLGGSDVEIRAPSESMARIQEIHLLAIHALCDFLDQQLLGN